MAEDRVIGNIATLQDKVAVVTGGSSGLGRAICLAYAAAGAYVLSADLRPEIPEQKTIGALATNSNMDLVTPTVELVNKRWPSQRSGVPRIAFVKCDVSKEEDVRGAVAEAVKVFGRLDVMVNNAGAYILTLPRINMPTYLRLTLHLYDFTQAYPPKHPQRKKAKT